MNLIVCVDDRMGMSFNHRRQSQDRVLREHMLQMAGQSILWVSPYTAKQFKESSASLQTAEDFTVHAGKSDFCFVEFAEDLPDWSLVQSIVLYRWNRTYPYDQKLEIPTEFHMTKTEEFSGHSHELITMEVFER